MRSIIKRDQVRMTVGMPVPPVVSAPQVAPAPSAGAHGKTARLLRADGRVRAIELTCSCGSTTVLELEYDLAPETTGAAESLLAPAGGAEAQGKES